MTTYFRAHSGRIHALRGNRAACGARCYPDSAPSDEAAFGGRPCKICLRVLAAKPKQPHHHRHAGRLDVPRPPFCKEVE